MKKEAVILQLQRLEVKLQDLLEEHREIKQQLLLSRDTNAQLKQTILQQNEELKNFQNQLKISKIVTSIAEGTPHLPELRLKINEYIKEIDKCIAHLSE